MSSHRHNKFLLLLALVFALALPTAAQARILACRSDPVVILSNGVVLDLSAEVTTLLVNVEEVHYELRVPVGVTAIAWVHTPAWLTSQETFTIIADQPANTYAASATARTRDGNATVTTHLLLLTALGVKLDYAAASGPENVPIWVRVAHTKKLLGLF
jgi:hypothetical protein